MHGSLSLRSGVLYVGRHELTAHVRTYDLDGHPIGAGFSFRGLEGGPARIAGLDVDSDRRIWIADQAAHRVRVFNLFGREIGGFGPVATSGTEERGALGGLADLCFLSGGDEDHVLVTRGGERRHAAQVFRTDGHWVASLRPQGEPQGTFRGLRRAACAGRLTWLCEGGAGRVQVFRDHEFHFLFKVPVRPGGRFEPIAVAPLDDGRLVLATGGRDSSLLLVDAAGRLLRVLATGGDQAGEVRDPEDLAVERVAADGPTRIAVVDRDAERVQVFTVDGRCHGALTDLPGEAQ